MLHEIASMSGHLTEAKRLFAAHQSALSALRERDLTTWRELHALRCSPVETQDVAQLAREADLHPFEAAYEESIMALRLFFRRFKPQWFTGSEEQFIAFGPCA